MEPGGTYENHQLRRSVFSRESDRDVVPSKQDPLPEAGRIIYQPGSEEDDKEETQDEVDGAESAPQAQEPQLRRSSRQSVPPDRINLHTTTEECEKAYERIEHSLLTGSELASVGTGTPGSVGYMPSDPANYNEAVSGPDAELWKDSMRDEARSLIDHDVFDWTDPPEGVTPIPAKFIFKRKFNHDGVPVRLKSRVVVQGFHEPETGADKAAPVASMESVQLLVAAGCSGRTTCVRPEAGGHQNGIFTCTYTRACRHHQRRTATGVRMLPRTCSTGLGTEGVAVLFASFSQGLERHLPRLPAGGNTIRPEAG